MLEDLGGGASVEYFRKDERKVALGIRAEARGARRAEALKEEVRVFMMVVQVAGCCCEGEISEGCVH